MKRHVIEGTWSGYRASQEHVVHRVVTTNKSLINWVKRIQTITFTDGTYLYLAVREAKLRERVVAREPGKTRALFDLASAYTLTNQTTRARAIVQQLLALEPAHERARALLNQLAKTRRR